MIFSSLKTLFAYNIIFVIAVIFIERKRPMYTLFWIMLLILAPYVGFIFYLFFGLSFRKKRLAKKFYSVKFLKSNKIIKHSQKNELFRWEKLINYLEMTSINSLTTENDLETYITGKDFFDSLKKELSEAKERINMEYYIFRYDTLGKEICDILVERAQNGVEINIIIDGANQPSRKMIKILKENGVNANIFFPSYFPLLKIGNLRANYRDHRKLCIIDNKLAFLGGFNIGDEYLGHGKMGNWKDLGVKVMGEIVLEIEKEFYFSISLVSKNDISYSSINYRYSDLISKKLSEKGNTHGYMQIVSSGPNYEYKPLRDNYLKLIQEARKSILIQTPYFIPDDVLLDVLKMSAISGVQIKIMIPGKPDHPFVYWANQYYVGELIDLGVEFYYYNNGFLHSKLTIVDNEVVCVGSGNFDCRSFYQNFEMNINIYERDSALKFKQIFYDDMLSSTKIDREDFNERSFMIKMKESICRLFSPVL